MKKSMKTAVITGASRGVGKAVAEALAREGWRLILNCRSRFDTLDQVAAALAEQTEVTAIHGPIDEAVLGKYLGIDLNAFTPVNPANVSDPFARRTHIEEDSADQLLLINNGGISTFHLAQEVTDAELEEMLDANLKTMFRTTRAMIPYLLKAGKGAVINISSVTASSSSPHGACYGATKAGLLSFSRSLFDEVRKYGVRVTAVLPDMTDTALYRNADFEADPQWDAHLNPEDVADAVRYALSVREGSCVPEIMIRPQLHRIHKKPRT